MSKKPTPFERPVTPDNLVPMLQSRIANRAKFISQAENTLREQRGAIRNLREMARRLGDELTVEQKKHCSNVISSIRLDIKSLALDQKVDRVQLRETSDMRSYISYLERALFIL